MTRNQQKALFAAAGLGLGVLGRGLLKARKTTAEMRGSVVFITGGSRGLGLAMAREFAANGAKIVICARDESELDRASHDLKKRGAVVLTLRCDVRDREAVESAIDQAVAYFGRIDVLVNNAGVIEVGPVENMSVEDFKEAMDVMFWGVVYPTLAVLPRMVARKSGRIVNITSIGGKVSVPHLLPYSCAKFAAVGFSEGLRAELLGKGITVTTIAPGLMRTGSFLNAFFQGKQEDEAAWFGIGSSLPLVSMSAERAASQIVEATRRGEAERVLTMPAKVLSHAHGAAPGVIADLLGLANLLLPRATKSKRRSVGRALMRLPLPWMQIATFLGRKAARRLLQPAASRA
jgi:short-subunit dehydrogenase